MVIRQARGVLIVRERAYRTPRALASATKKYFSSISRTVSAVEMVPTGRKDEMGHEIYEPREVKNDAGEVIRYREYAVPPRMTALYRALGISKQTWSRYASGKIGDDEAQCEAYAMVCEDARCEVEDYLRSQVLTRTKGVTGIIHELRCNYGDKPGAEVEIVDRGGNAPVSMAERRKVLGDLGLLGGADEGGE